MTAPNKAAAISTFALFNLGVEKRDFNIELKTLLRGMQTYQDYELFLMFTPCGDDATDQKRRAMLDEFTGSLPQAVTLVEVPETLPEEFRFADIVRPKGYNEHNTLFISDNREHVIRIRHEDCDALHAKIDFADNLPLPWDNKDQQTLRQLASVAVAYARKVERKSQP